MKRGQPLDLGKHYLFTTRACPRCLRRGTLVEVQGKACILETTDGQRHRVKRQHLQRDPAEDYRPPMHSPAKSKREVKKVIRSRRTHWADRRPRAYKAGFVANWTGRAREELDMEMMGRAKEARGR